MVAIMLSNDNLQTDIINIANPSETQMIDILDFLEKNEEPKVVQPKASTSRRRSTPEFSYSVVSMYCIGRRLCSAITKYELSGEDCRLERIVIWIDTSCTDNPEGASLLGKLTHSIQDEERSKSLNSRKSSCQKCDSQSCDEDNSYFEAPYNYGEYEYIWGVYLGNLFLCTITQSMEYCLYFFINSTKTIFSPSNGKNIKTRKSTLQKDKFISRGSIWEDKTKAILVFSDDRARSFRKTVLKLKL
jgi:hypothetical protein